MRLSRTRACTLALVGIAIPLTAVTPTKNARAHEEPMHAVATMLAHEYLAAISSTKGHPYAARAGKALSTIDRVTKSAVTLPADPTLANERRYILGMAPEQILGEPAALVPRADTSPPRSHPTLSSYGSTTIAREIPNGRGALLGFLTANVDTHADMWVSAESPYQYVEDKVEDAIRNMARGGGYSLGCPNVPFVGELCKVAEVLVGVVVGGACLLWDLGGAPGGSCAESVAEDMVSGCQWTSAGDQLADQTARSAKIDGEPISRSVESSLRDDEGFYDRYGINNRECNTSAEQLGLIGKLVTPGRPVDSAGLILATRARLLDYMLIEKQRGEFGIDAHFRAYEPWFLSAEATKRKWAQDRFGEFTGSSVDWKRWRLESFTMVNHFLDILSPSKRDPVDGYAPIGNMRVGRGGLTHPWDGYSLSQGKSFYPNATLVVPPAAQDPFRVFSIRHFDRDVVLRSAEKLRTLPDYASGYQSLRRRVCDPNEAPSPNGKPRPSLRTRDGLGWSLCRKGAADGIGAVPDTNKNIIARANNAPSDIGALDGFDQWMHGGAPAALEDEAGNGYTRPGAYLAFVRAMSKSPVTPPSMSPHHCGTQACEGAPGQTYDAAYRRFLETAPRAHGDALRLVGLATAIHLNQDATMAAHLGAGTGYGHRALEQFASKYVFPHAVDGLWSQNITLLVTAGGAGARGPNIDISPLLGANAGEKRGMFSLANDDPDVVYRNMLATIAADGTLWTNVTAELNALSNSMSQLATPTCGSKSFSVRRTVWATAHRTAKFVRDVGAGFNVAGLGGYDAGQTGFWLASSLADDRVERNHDDTSIESSHSLPFGQELLQARQRRFGATNLARNPTALPTWKDYVDRTFPLLVATTVQMMLGAAEALENPATTCDGDGTTDPPAAANDVPPAPGPGKSCEEKATAEARACLDQGGALACVPYSNIAAFRDCLPSHGRGSNCARVLEVVGRCACPERTSGSKLSLRTEACVQEALRDDKLEAMMAAGLIDRETADHQRLAGPDSDSDGIPDPVDRCPVTAVASPTRIEHTTIRAAVCLRSEAPACAGRYGCEPLPTPSASGDAGR